MELLIHAGIKVNPCLEKGPLIEKVQYEMIVSNEKTWTKTWLILFIAWDLIIDSFAPLGLAVDCPCPCYLLLSQHSSYVVVNASLCCKLNVDSTNLLSVRENRAIYRLIVVVTNHLRYNAFFTNGLMPNRRQAITWTNVDPVNWRKYAALGGDELTRHLLTWP